MITEEIILKDMTKLVTAGDERAWALLEVRDERVESVLIERGQIDAARHEDRIRDLGNRLQRSLNSIKNCLEDTCPQVL